MRTPPNKATITALALLLVVGFLLVRTHQSSHAQQEPNRQLVQPEPATSTASKRIALVIGNGAYTRAPQLKNPPNDARDMAATLKALGFDVTSGTNVNQREMKRLVREFGQKLKAGGSGLFYYAGHGVQSKGRNYLIPVDADIQSEAEVEDSGVDIGLVLNFMDDAQNGLNIVILDACRNNPFARSFRSATDGLAQVDAPTGTLIAYSTAPGRVASDGTGQNGLYTSELLKQMRVPGLTATEMFMRVRAEVMKQTANKQVPWEASSLVGSFYFSVAKNAGTMTSLPANEVKVDPMAFELSYWETIKNSTNADDYRAYLEKYPNGEFVPLAKNRLVPLAAAEKDKVPAEPARTPKSFKGQWGYMGSGTLIIAPNKIQFVFDDSNRDSSTNPAGTKEDSSCNGFAGARVEGNVIRDITYSDSTGKLILKIKRQFEAESAAAANEALATVHQVCALSGKNSTSAGNDSAVEAADPNIKIFGGYLGIMSAGFSARPGKLVVAASGIQFVWDKGTAGIADNNKTVDYKLHPDPAPTLLQCSYFAVARTDGFFIREINTNNPAALVEVTGWGGAVVRFRASSPAEAAAAFAAVRESCKSQTK